MALLLALTVLVAPSLLGSREPAVVAGPPAPISAYRGLVAWSRFDGRYYRLMLGTHAAPVLPTLEGPFDADVGPGPGGKPVVVYSRYDRVFAYDPRTRRERRMVTGRAPTVYGDRMAWIHGGGEVYLAPFTRAGERSHIANLPEDVDVRLDLTGHTLLVVDAGDLYRVDIRRSWTEFPHRVRDLRLGEWRLPLREHRLRAG